MAGARNHCAKLVIETMDNTTLGAMAPRTVTERVTFPRRMNRSMLTTIRVMYLMMLLCAECIKSRRKSDDKSAWHKMLNVLESERERQNSQ